MPTVTGNLIIDADKEDNEGMITANSSSLNLTVQVSLKVTGKKEAFTSVTITPTFTNNQYSDNGLNGTLLDCETITVDASKFSGSEENGWTAIADLTFTFGTATEGLNPSRFLDPKETIHSEAVNEKSAEGVMFILNSLLEAYKSVSITLDVKVNPAE